MSHRDSVDRPAGGRDGRPPARTTTADRRLRGRGARALRRPVPPRGRPHPARAGDARRTSSTASPAPRPSWTPAAVIEQQVARDPRAGRRRARALRALGRRRQRRRGAARPQGGRRPAHLRLRRPRLPAQATRPRRWSRPSAATSACRSSTSRPQERFLARLAGVTDPEEKRKRIGEEFIRVFEEEARALGRRPLARPGDALLRRDRVGRRATASPPRSRATTTSAGLPADMQMKLVEPLRSLFKDEVRRVGEELGLPERMVWRQPFPGPGSRSASSARSPPSGSRRCARPTRSCRRRSAAPGSTGSSGSRSRCCRRSARSACRATRAPTATRS